MNTILITIPDDWHLHLRDNELLNYTVNATARHFNKALIMPNLQPPLTSIQSIIKYRERILAALNPEYSFNPLMTFYLNQFVSQDEILQCRHHPFIVGGKLYPAGVTTNSAQGVSNLKTLYPLLEAMQSADLVLQIHGESIEDDIFEREEQFIQQELMLIIRNFPKLRIVLEHISTRSAVEFILSTSDNIAATITPQHLFYNRNHLLAGGIKPHYYCLPILKHASDQKALQEAAVSGNPKFFAGTDSAPHLKQYKESACGCAGIYSAPYAIAIYAEIFAALNRLPQLNNFLSRFGNEFYHFPNNSGELCLVKQEQWIAKSLYFGSDEVIPIAAGERLSWSIHESV